MGFQSTLPIQGATDDYVAEQIDKCISIHAPHTGSDPSDYSCRKCGSNFNPRSPYRERLEEMIDSQWIYDFNPRSPYRERQLDPLLGLSLLLFQSTLPIQGATIYTSRHKISLHNFNPRSPYRERPASNPMSCSTLGFQSTLPIQGATEMWY